MSSGTEVVFNTIVPPGLTPFLEQLHQAGFTERGGKIICTYFDENFLNLVPAEQVEGLYSCLDWYQEVSDPHSRELLRRYNARFPGSAMLTAGSGCTGHYRALKLWEAAVQEARTVDRDAVIRALDHARIAEGPGGPAEMVPGQHHVRMNMYIAQAQDGRFEIAKSLGPSTPASTCRQWRRCRRPCREGSRPCGRLPFLGARAIVARARGRNLISEWGAGLGSTRWHPTAAAHPGDPLGARRPSAPPR